MSDNPAEAYILREIEEIDRKIKDLSSARSALQGVLARIQRSGVTEFGKQRRNSADRILVETRIIEELNKTSRPLSSSRLYGAAKTVLSDLKDGTFRSYLHRMKIRGVIINPNGSSGSWRLAGVAQSFLAEPPTSAANNRTTEPTSEPEPTHPPPS